MLHETVQVLALAVVEVCPQRPLGGRRVGSRTFLNLAGELAEIDACVPRCNLQGN